MNKRKFTFLAVLLALAICLTACGGTASSQAAGSAAASSAASSSEAASSEAGDLLSQIKEKGEITIAMEGNWSPWTYHDDSGELVGYDTEIGRAIAEYLGVEPNFVEGGWDGLLAGLDSGRYDIMINGVDVTPEREEKYDFSDPYAYIRTALVVRGDNTDITSFEDLNGKTTANSIGSTYMELAESYGATVLGVDTLDETIQVLLAGRADATLNADVSFLDYLNVHPDADIKIVAEADDANSVAIPMRKGDETAALREEINKALAQMREDGTLTALSEKYFGSDVSTLD